MRKVFTLFCVLMAAFFSIGVANAQSALTSFEVSTKPTGNTFDANTHWYVMKLKGMFITVENVDGEGNIKLTADNTLTSTNIKSGADQWCIVGSDSEGYQLYNKKAGVTKVLGLENATSTVQSESHYTNYGKSRAQMYDAATTTSSAADGKVGTTFVIRSKEGKPATSFFIGLKDANVTNRYFNSRGDYLAYWQDNGSYGDDGSVVTFYDAETYWTTYWDLASYKSLAATVSNLQGTTPFTTYPAEAVSTFKTAIQNAESKTESALSHVQAIALKSTLNDAKWTLRKRINGPAVSTIYKMKCTYDSYIKFIHAPYPFAAGHVLPLSSTENDRSVGWVFEPNTNGTYKIKSADTGMYIGGTTEFKSVVNSSEATDFVIAAATDGGTSNFVIGTGDNLSAHQWFHANDTKLISWETNAGASRWEFIEVSGSDYANLNDLRLASVLSVPGVDANSETISSALTAYNESKTAEKWNNLANAVNQILDSKYYRIKNLRNNKQQQHLGEDYTIMATDGNLKPKMYQPTQSQYLVSTIWKFKVGNGGLLLSNVNNPNQYVAALTNAPDEEGHTANNFTASDNAELFVLSKADNVDYYVIRDVKGNLLNGEDSGNFPINYWNGGLNQKSTQWQINEATSLEVALNNNEVDGKSYASVYLPFSVSSVNDGVKAYVAKEPGTNEVTFTETTNGVMANKGFLLISDNAAATATVNIGESTTDSKMLGTLTDLNLTNEDKSTYRVFGKNSSNQVGFFAPSDNLNAVKANRGFFTVATGGALRLNFEDSVVSGIDAIEANQALHNAPIFDLSGRRVMNTVKGGLYIQNGRKFIVK